MSTSLRHSNLHKCCVKNCHNLPLPGRHTCGRHGRRHGNRHGGRSIRFVHLDCNVPDLIADLEPINTADGVTIEVRDNGAILGLPTNRPQMIEFLRGWLARGHSLATIEALTPAVIQPDPLYANAFCRIADLLVRYDLGGAA